MGWESMLGVGFDGIGVETITLKSQAGLARTDEGKVGRLSADSEIGLCSAGDMFYGVIETVDLGGGVSTVQRKGFKTVAYTGAPAVGLQELVGNGAGGVMPPAAATLATGVVANNNAITWTAKKTGTAGNDITLTLIDPPGNNVALSVDVVGRDINVTLATDGASAITSTAAQVIAAIAASSAADLVTAANTGASTGAAAVVAVAATSLAGGTDGRKLFVASIDSTAHTLVLDLG